MKSSQTFIKKLRKSDRIIVGVTWMDKDIDFVANDLKLPSDEDAPVLVIDADNYIKFASTGVASSFFPAQKIPVDAIGLMTILL